MQLEALPQVRTSREYGRGQLVYRPGDVASSVYFLERGLVRIYRLSPSGGELTLGYVQAGELFGEQHALGGEARESYAEARRPSTVWRTSRHSFLGALQSNPALLAEVTAQLGRRLAQAERRVEDLVFRDVRSRLARVLLQLAEPCGRDALERISITPVLNQVELANLVGSTRQSVNRILRDLRREHLLDPDAAELVILDPVKLQRIADGESGLEPDGWPELAA